MKKIILSILIVTLVFSISCSKEKTDENVLRIGATPVPHAEILELVKPELKKEGIELEIIEFTDYIKPNIALNDGEIDANFYQHIPYLEKFNKENNMNLNSFAKIHIEPLGLYSNKYGKIDKLSNGSLIAIPSDSVNGSRALKLLENNGLIKINKDAGLKATENDIIENPKKLKFKAIEAAQLPRILPDVDAAIINGNYALEANLNPLKDSLLLEDKESPYANVIAIKNENEKLEILVKHLKSQKVKDFIIDEYNGGVVPTF